MRRRATVARTLWVSLAIGLPAGCGGGADAPAVPEADRLPLAPGLQRAADERVCPVSPKSCVRWILLEGAATLTAQARTLERHGWVRTLGTADRIEYESGEGLAVRVERLDRFLRDFRDAVAGRGTTRQEPGGLADRVRRARRDGRRAFVATLIPTARAADRSG